MKKADQAKPDDEKELAIPVLLNLEAMYEELIHEPEFIEHHSQDGRHVKQAVLLHHGLDMSADSWL